MAVTTTRPRKRILGNYELLKPLGEGGMARVYLARHQATGAQVVVKLMREDRARDPAFRRLFQSELRAMMRFRHPLAVALIDASSETDDQPFLVLEYVLGVTLEQLLATHGRLSHQRVGSLLGALCIVLDAAHGQGMLHRDLTAANLMIVGAGTDDETIKVMDFGLAQLGGFYISFAKLQGAGGGIGGGTPDYVCPEQIRGDEVDARGDIYSVGVLLYQALTGHLPFEAERDVSAILLAHRDRTPPTFADFGVALPAAIEEVVQRCLAKYPAERPASARELASQFGTALGRPIARAQDFDAADRPASLDEPKRSFAPEAIIDRFDAWMPESIAVMKLRGFVQDGGGEVIDSLPGLIRVQFPSPSGSASSAPRGLLGWFRSAPPPCPCDEIIELHLQKQPSAVRSLVNILVVRVESANESHTQRTAGGAYCRKVCSDLRAYLMIGR
jgi:eukaryotic-like serine/threonine-protein kinase